MQQYFGLAKVRKPESEKHLIRKKKNCKDKVRKSPLFKQKNIYLYSLNIKDVFFLLHLHNKVMS